MTFEERYGVSRTALRDEIQRRLRARLAAGSDRGGPPAPAAVATAVRRRSAGHYAPKGDATARVEDLLGRHVFWPRRSRPGGAR